MLISDKFKSYVGSLLAATSNPETGENPVFGQLAQGSLSDALGLAQMHALLTANGWTWTTAVSAVLFFLLHWPCSTTLWTIRRETGSAKWTLLAALLPTALGMALCAAFTALARLIGW